MVEPRSRPRRLLVVSLSVVVAAIAVAGVAAIVVWPRLAAYLEQRREEQVRVAAAIEAKRLDDEKAEFFRAKLSEIEWRQLGYCLDNIDDGTKVFAVSKMRKGPALELLAYYATLSSRHKLLVIGGAVESVVAERNHSYLEGRGMTNLLWQQWCRWDGDVAYHVQKLFESIVADASEPERREFVPQLVAGPPQWK
jgi:hypothetical protein